MSNSGISSSRHHAAAAAAEHKAIQRFTVGFDKLCKSCPMRLQPRVDTLTEMILGLPEQERDDLLATVSRRLQQAEPSIITGMSTAQEVYEFQMNSRGDDTFPSKNKSTDTAIPKRQGDKTIHGDYQDVGMQDDLTRRAMEKMERARSKLAQTDAKLARMNHLLDVTSVLLKGRRIAEDEDDEEIDELRSMSRDNLKLQLLKYTEKQAKLMRSKAKSLRKRFAASLELGRLRTAQQDSP